MSPIARAVFLAALAGAALAACDYARRPKESTRPASSAKPAAPEAVLPAQMVAAVSSGKTASSVSVHFALQAVPAVGQPLPVDIAIVPHEAFNSVHAIFEAPEALALTTGKRLEKVDDAKPESVVTHKLLLHPAQEGVFIVTAAVDTETDEGSVTRIYSIPVIVNAPIPAKPTVGTPAASPSG